MTPRIQPLSQLLSTYLPERQLGLLTELSVAGICLDSRQVADGDLFMALAGTQVDGRQFIDDAIAAGAVAVVAQTEEAVPTLEWRNKVAVVGLPSLAQQAGSIVSAFYGNPSHALNIYGVTGTNGKTSCSHYLAQILESLGVRCGVMGTLGLGFIGNLQSSLNTTADLVTTHRFMAELVDAGVLNLSMEASSHGLEQGRTSGVGFTTAIFTNLTRDHLDYHGSMEEYARAKAMLFSTPSLKYAVINEDDRYASLMKTQLRNGVEALGYSLRPGTADIYPRDVQFLAEGIRAILVTPWGEVELNTPLLGAFNLANLIAVIGALGLQGYPLNDLLQAANSLKAVDGRMQRFGGGGRPLVIVDYAHTPDALESLLAAVATHCEGRVTCLFGCGGDRDPGKRPLMLKAALKGAGSVIVTSDNPRSEDPEQIIADVLLGADEAARSRTLSMGDRAAAIAAAVSTASPQDIVVVAGKGHEAYQEIKGVRYPFSDQQQVELALQQWQGAQS
ncbi:UDP-N-acetylmuramoyl-L-alanyl-D-glutamate--2,6-diaminopimelate ligase [Aestuariirhabdus litorea]|uniref:UDP-N-acetylmuramoyl-L-alanyl-D-glutamate--2,6-diaminopimelate ligase n=1 Tax=Aestuariirhabdus litorea TaxID=2528527 RepID=A0A3P3VV93_9GAMM|nr:UDP-N-acetylmuramoyl-L-alanyl-D-glutamate--2,6-diaminopimelate ligase [Aestuariirhabdus litorea]RRJ85349.1 UDP-N-acetylmuramoyl-L-alanyl-D-glutamate--2,6-diaminopimelate ligase [Aestuariirhabdus litorea]RWW98573.1 UDP-N-acetylmuramoyl-L-alanyl-D-glutamate--2,6-diaminopimelate ligase [Endozoicomonadaceae bacterium GTF-13]